MANNLHPAVVVFNCIFYPPRASSFKHSFMAMVLFLSNWINRRLHIRSNIPPNISFNLQVFMFGIKSVPTQPYNVLLKNSIHGKEFYQSMDDEMTHLHWELIISQRAISLYMCVCHCSVLCVCLFSTKQPWRTFVILR